MIIRIAFGKQQIETRQYFDKIQINFKLISLSLFKMISIYYKYLLHGEKHPSGAVNFWPKTAQNGNFSQNRLLGSKIPPPPP